MNVNNIFFFFFALYVFNNAYLCQLPEFQVLGIS